METMTKSRKLSGLECSQQDKKGFGELMPSSLVSERRSKGIR